VLDQINQEGIDSIASVLLSKLGKVGVRELGERRDLEPAAVVGLAEAFGERVEKSRHVSIPEWESVGQVDVVVRSTAPADEFSLLAELKWCGPHHDVLYESVWDGFKMALATLRADMPYVYLVTGAHESIWSSSLFADLYETRDHDPVELCMRELGGRDRRLAWDALLQGGYDRHPASVPERFHTTVVGRAAVGEAELRAVQVTRATNSMIPFINGWPHGVRPKRARHPKVAEAEAAPASRFVETDDDIQWDPFTDPANQKLIEDLKRIGAWHVPDPEDDEPPVRPD
jgi:hypothetical protein